MRNLQAQYVTVMNVRSYDNHQQDKNLAAYYDKVARLIEGDLKLPKINCRHDYKESVSGLIDDCNNFIKSLKRRDFLREYRK